MVAERHYCIPPLERVDLAELLGLVGDERYFVVHAPRQTGKTSILLALRDLLNSGAAGAFRCVYANVEVAQTAREDVGRAMRAILGELANRGICSTMDSWTSTGPASWKPPARTTLSRRR